MRTSFLLAVAVLACTLSASVLHRDKEKQQGNGKDLDATLWVNCGDTKPDKQITVTSPTLVSKNSGAAAWVKVESADCRNATELWMAGNSNEVFRLAYRQRPQDPDLWGNGMRMIDWSPDGQLLLTEAWQWNTQANDAAVDKRILLFSARGAAVFEIDPDLLWGDQKDLDCAVDFQLLGFTAEGWVALKAHVRTASDEGEAGKPTGKQCQEKNQVWAIDPAKQTRRLLPDGFQAAPNSVLTKTAKVPE